MKTDAEYVTVTLKVAPGVVVAEKWDDAALVAASRTVVLEAVDNLAKQYDCGILVGLLTPPVSRRARGGGGSGRVRPRG
ncbi:hypothetical protein ACFCV9_29560 [Streptomyces sp. NPDC056367]|uniref:hypothetical protein n=1 Tax=Streptomyces sp. NPDC056367 TaxID=3345797 RepID=UPI0035D9EB4D